MTEKELTRHINDLAPHSSIMDLAKIIEWVLRNRKEIGEIVEEIDRGEASQDYKHGARHI